MLSVRVEPSGDGWSCQVSVESQGQRSQHSVTVTRADLERWGRGTEEPDVEDLVRRSFEFLLEREPPSSILASFQLSVIRRYFPEYDRLFRQDA